MKDAGIDVTNHNVIIYPPEKQKNEVKNKISMNKKTYNTKKQTAFNRNKKDSRNIGGNVIGTIEE